MNGPAPTIGANPRSRRLAITAALVVGAILIIGAVAGFYTEVLWHRESGYGVVFWNSIWTKAALGVSFGAAFAVLLLLNLWIVRRITSPTRLFSVPDQVLERYRATLQPYTRWVVIAGALLFGLFAGSGATVKWRDYLLYRNAVDFGSTDPVFGRDIGFYVFKLPFLQFVFTWALSTLIVVTIVVGLAHYFMGGIRPQARGDRVSPEVRAHLSVLLGLIVLLKAWGYRLDQFNLMFSPRGTVTGASYTDVNAQLPALRLLVIIAIVCAVLFLVNARFKNWLLPIGGLGLLALMSLVAGGVYPAAVQRLRVTPNERVRERPYIERNITATREAFGIDKVQLTGFNPTQTLNQTVAQRNRPTIENIRLWDPSILVDTYLNLQRIKQYYEFLDVDVDRYEIDGTLRQVMLSAREIDTEDLSADARTWLNTHLVYTHGYGVVASRVDRVTGEGQPAFVLRNIPSQSTGAPEVTQPRIYFGENADVPFVIVNSEQLELDYPQGEGFAQNRYEGEGGIRLNSMLRRAAFAWRFRDANVLISGAIRPESKIIIRRNIMDRLNAVAPFLTFDDDPYIAVIDGRLKWIADAYTTTTMYPYSQRVNLAEVSEGHLSGSANYMRNAVKFVIDAEHGTVDAYAWDEDDPILKAYMKAFPGVWKPRSEMSDELLAHVRYPEGMFRVQSNRFGNYHITDPDNFYSKEDAWLVGGDPRPSAQDQLVSGASPPLAPYYVLMRLPGEGELRFVLVRPFTPNGRDNLTAYLVAHGDPETYGKLVAYVVPKSENIFGPKQVQARINGDTAVSQQISLWNQQNSRVIYGNLLIVPIEQSLLYVQPLYLLGQGSNLPELKRVVAVVGERVVMADTLDSALAQIFGRAPPSEPTQPDAGGTQQELITRALRHLQAADEARLRGDLGAYQRETTAARRLLEQSQRPSPSPTP